MSRKRDPYADVGVATREMIDRALSADPPLSKRELRIVLVAVRELSTWSRLSDRISVNIWAVLARFASDDGTIAPGWARRRAAEQLRSLHARAVFTYTAGKGSKSRPRIDLSVPMNGSQIGSPSGRAARGKGSRRALDGEPETAPLTPAKGSRFRAGRGADVRGTPRSPRTQSEEDSEGASAAPSADAPGAQPTRRDVDRVVDAMDEHFPALWDLLPCSLDDMNRDDLQIVEDVALGRRPTSALSLIAPPDDLRS